MDDSKYLPRLLDGVLTRLLSDFAAVMIVGPRAGGKTTTARRHARSFVRLDVPGEAALFAADPDAALADISEFPVLLDEWQAVPEILGAVKRAVDDRRGAGRYILAGSVRAELDAPTWPGTGRVIPTRMFGLTEREIRGLIDSPAFLDRLASADLDRFVLPEDAPDVIAYVELAMQGGYPDVVLAGSDEARRVWLEAYVDQVVNRDAAGVNGTRDPGRLRRYLRAVALNTAGLVERQTLYDAARVDRKTASAYDALLAGLFVLDFVPPWFENRLSRLVKSPKRYLIDPSLVPAILQIDRGAVLRSGDLLGRMLDTFVMAQLRAEAEMSRPRPQLHHLREKNGRREIDVVAEMGSGTVVALEVKASSAPAADDARHLIWLRDLLGERFLAGAVLHTGPRPFRLSDRIFALPICALWSP